MRTWCIVLMLVAFSAINTLAFGYPTIEIHTSGTNTTYSTGGSRLPTEDELMSMLGKLTAHDTNQTIMLVPSSATPMRELFKFLRKLKELHIRNVIIRYPDTWREGAAPRFVFMMPVDLSKSSLEIDLYDCMQVEDSPTVRERNICVHNMMGNPAGISSGSAKCPSGGKYTIPPVGEMPSCSIHGKMPGQPWPTEPWPDDAPQPTNAPYSSPAPQVQKR